MVVTLLFVELDLLVITVFQFTILTMRPFSYYVWGTRTNIRFFFFFILCGFVWLNGMNVLFSVIG